MKNGSSSNFTRLNLPQLSVSSLKLQQVIMVSFLYHLTISQHQNSIRMSDRGKSVSNNQRSFPFCDSGKTLLDRSLCFSVNRTGCLIKNHDWSIFKDRPCNTETLPLSPREPNTSLTHNRLITIWQGHDEIM